MADTAATRTVEKHGPAAAAVRCDPDYADALRQADTWAEGGYTTESRAYWRGVRDTLRVVLGVTERPPADNTTNPAATVLLSGGRV